jgi:hypothetical protein
MSAPDTFAAYVDLAYGPARKGAAVTPHATNPLGFATKGLIVGGSGNLTVRFIDDTSDTVIAGVVAGTILPIRVTHVRVAGTTATNIVAFG